MSKDMTSGPIHTDLHIFLLWVINQMWHGPSLGNQGGRELFQDQPANYTSEHEGFPRALLEHSAFLTCELTWGRLFQDYLTFNSQEGHSYFEEICCMSKLFSLLPFYPPATSGVTLQSHILRCEREVTVSIYLCYCALLTKLRSGGSS